MIEEYTGLASRFESREAIDKYLEDLAPKFEGDLQGDDEPDVWAASDAASQANNGNI